MSIRAKILIWFSLLGIIPTIIIGLYSSYQSTKSIQDKVVEMSIATTAQTITSIDDRLQYVEKSFNTAIQNDTILEELDNLPRQNVVDRAFSERKIANYFNKVTSNHPYIKTIAIIPNTSELKVYGEGTAADTMTAATRFFLSGEYKSKDWFKDISVPENANKMCWQLIDVGGESVVCLVKNFSFFSYARQMGVAVAILDNVALGDYMTPQSTDYFSLIVTSDGLDASTGEKNLFSLPTAADNVFASENKQNFVITAKLNNSWQYAHVIYKDYLFADVSNMQKNTLLFIFITIGIFILLAVVTSISIGSRIKLLIKKFERLRVGDFTVDSQLSGKDELVIIEQNYNYTVEKLSQLIDQNYVYKLEKREAQLMALQYQIDPHFLYNTLELINSMAAMHGADDVRELAQRMGRLYRYNGSRGSGMPTLLRDEIKHIENYIYLQNMQMSGRLQTFFDIDENLLDCSVIRFILQPIVENCIKHGFEGKSGTCFIEISALREDKYLEIKVRDDGVGVTTQRLAQVEEEMKIGQDTIGGEQTVGIGLRNVHSRLVLKYGVDCGLTLESGPNGGTTVTARLLYSNNKEV